MPSPGVPPSIEDLMPLEVGGRIARRGFEYQDHVAVSFCLDLLECSDLLQVWCETHDDITLLWKRDGDVVVEFVQVKSSNLASRWSMYELCKREQAKPGSSILEQSLMRARCKEKALFRMITFVDVNHELEILKLKVDHPDRGDGAVATLQNEVERRLPGVESASGLKCCDWVKSCHWEPRESQEAIENKNLVRLDTILHKQGHEISPDHRKELYKNLLALVQRASSVERSDEPDGHKINRALLEASINTHLSRMGYGATSSVPQDVQTKMRRCDLSEEAIANAADLRRAYRTELLAAKYVPADSRKYAEQEVTAILQDLISQLDAGEIDDNGIEFHNRCLQALGQVRDSWPADLPCPSLAVIKGYMYERTNRCAHRFDRAQP